MPKKLRTFAPTVTDTELQNRHSFHANPNEIQLAHYDAIRSRFLEMAKMVRDHVPPGREQAIALTKLEEAQFFAIAGCSRNQIAFESPNPVPGAS